MRIWGRRDKQVVRLSAFRKGRTPNQPLKKAEPQNQIRSAFRKGRTPKSDQISL